MENLQQKFNQWLDEEMEKVKGDAIAYCVIIYDEGFDEYSVDLVAFDKYDEGDEDWACGDGIYASHCGEETLLYFYIKKGWEACLQQVGILIEGYMEQGKYGQKLKDAQAVGYGFDDGDIEII